jgi:formylglycine-generating enzyme required for sulfatase activity
MRIYILFFLVFCFQSFQLPDKYHKPFSSKEIGENLYCWVFEAKNIDYKEFIYSMKHSPESRKFWPESKIWLSAYKSSFTSDSCWKDPAFDNYPVVGVSYSQVQEYIKWLNERVNEIIGSEKVTYNYRLPSKEEWLKMDEITTEISWNDELYAYKSNFNSKTFMHVWDNVSEMLTYTQPEAWLGFRVVCEVKDK